MSNLTGKATAIQQGQEDDKKRDNSRISMIAFFIIVGLCGIGIASYYLYQRKKRQMDSRTYGRDVH